MLPFDDDTPCRIIGLIEPDIWVKRAEYQGQTIPEHATMQAMGGAIEYVDTDVAIHTGQLIHQLNEVEIRQHEKGSADKK